MKVVARRRSGYTHDVEIDTGHTLVIDEPEIVGGNNLGPTPARVAAAGLAACTAITCEMYAARKGWELGDVEVEVHVQQSSSNQAFEEVTVDMRVSEPLDDDQLERLLTIAGKCPVHRALANEVPITDRIRSDSAA